MLQAEFREVAVLAWSENQASELERERERELSGGEFGRESGGCCGNFGGICKVTESQSRQRNFRRLREEGGEVDGVRKFRFPTGNGQNASFREIRISSLICGWQRGGRARKSRKKAWGERGGVRALIRGCRSTVGCRQGKLKIGERRLRGVDGREDGRSEASRTVDELLERESVVAAKMRSRKLGKMKTGKLGMVERSRGRREKPGREMGGVRGGVGATEIRDRQERRDCGRMSVGDLCGNVGSGNRGCRQLTEAGAGFGRETGNGEEGREMYGSCSPERKVMEEVEEGGAGAGDGGRNVEGMHGDGDRRWGCREIRGRG